MPPKKRFSAFDDFSDTKAVQQKVKPSILESTTETPAIERIERLTPSQMMPDRFQPRRLLPPSL